MNFLEATLAALALLSLALALWQWLAARRFPLHQRVTEPSSTPACRDEAPTLAAERRPAITLLKPLKGCDATTVESLQSWFNQNYAGQIQILFGVADASDPVCKIVRELIEKNPGRDAQLVVCAESPGANGKVSTLIQLERLAKHPLILVSDADVRVPPDFLANIVVPLRDSKVGLVNCFYRLANPATTAMRCEAVAINADFWSQVLQSTNLKPLDFALGAAMLTRRKLLEEIGGFAALVNCLADDYQLGHRIAQRGHRIVLCPVVVECWDAPMNWCRRLETSTALGAHHPRLPASAVFFQHPVQRHALAAVVADRIACLVKDTLRSAHRCRFFAHPNCPGAKSPAPIHAIARQHRAAVAGAGERFAAGGDLGRRVFGKHR